MAGGGGCDTTGGLLAARGVAAILGWEPDTVGTVLYRARRARAAGGVHWFPEPDVVAPRANLWRVGTILRAVQERDGPRTGYMRQRRGG